MSVPIILRAFAEEEAEDAVRWYDKERYGLGSDFVAELQKTLDEIAQQPDRFPIVRGDTREASLVRLPYCVYYRSRLGRVVVTAVFHTSRDPSVWQSRS